MRDISDNMLDAYASRDTQALRSLCALLDSSNEYQNGTACGLINTIKGRNPDRAELAVSILGFTGLISNDEVHDALASAANDAFQPVALKRLAIFPLTILKPSGKRFVSEVRLLQALIELLGSKKRPKGMIFIQTVKSCMVGSVLEPYIDKWGCL